MDSVNTSNDKGPPAPGVAVTNNPQPDDQNSAVVGEQQFTLDDDAPRVQDLFRGGEEDFIQDALPSASDPQQVTSHTNAVSQPPDQGTLLADFMQTRFNAQAEESKRLMQAMLDAQAEESRRKAEESRKLMQAMLDAHAEKSRKSNQDTRALIWSRPAPFGS